MAGPTPVPPPSQFVSGSTPTSGGASPTPAAGSTPKPNDRTEREKAILQLSESQLQVALKQGLVDAAELDRIKGAGYSVRLAQDPWGSAENKIAAGPAISLPARTSFTNTLPSGPEGQLGGAAAFNWAPAAGTTSQVPPAVTNSNPATTGTSAGGGATARSGGGGGSSAGAAPPPPAPPVPNSALDLQSRGAIPSGRSGIALLNGQQYRSPGSPVQVGEGQWQNVDAQGNPTGAIFKSETAANMAKQYVNYGPGMTSRFGNSPTAQAAQQGGFTQTLDKPLFDTYSLDQSIAAGAQKGIQGGDILGTISNNSGMPLDITYGGISQGGGLTPVGNPMDPFSSFTGQVPGASVGMSSILGNSGHDTMYWLSQMSGLPPSEVAKLGINSPEKALQFQQAVETARAQGRPVDFAPLYTQSEGAGGLYGGIRGGGIFSNSSTTPFDQSLAGFKDWSLGSPDLTYLPDPSGYGSTQIGNVAYGSNMLIDPNYYYGG